MKMRDILHILKNKEEKKLTVLITSSCRAWAGYKAQGTNLLNVEGYGTNCPGRSTTLKRRRKVTGGGQSSADESSCQISRSGSCSAYCYELLKFTPEHPAPSVFLSLHFNWLVVKFFKHCEIADIHCNIMWIIYRGCSRQVFLWFESLRGSGRNRKKKRCVWEKPGQKSRHNCI